MATVPRRHRACWRDPEHPKAGPANAAVRNAAVLGLAGAALLLGSINAAHAADPGNPYHDPPPLQATHGISDCPVPVARVLGPEEARREAHQRVERGTSCWLAGQCEPGGDYRNDAEVNKRVAAAIAADDRFATATVWVETLRKFVTLKGCLVDETQGRSLEAVVRSVPGVKLVWQEARVVRGPRAR